jgi:hypothetical protein
VKDDDGNPVPMMINGSDYADIDLNLKIDIGPSSTYSEELAQSTLEKLYDKQAITAEDYVEFSPKNVAPFKDRLLKKMQERQQQQAMMQQQLAQQQAMAQPDPLAQQQAQAQQQAAQMEHQKQLKAMDIEGKVAVAAMNQQARSGRS